MSPRSQAAGEQRPGLHDSEAYVILQAKSVTPSRSRGLGESVQCLHLLHGNLGD